MLYHTEIYIPEELKIKLKYMQGHVLSLTYSKHAILAAQDDRYGSVNLLSSYRFNTADIIELETDSKTGKLVKVLVRFKYDDNRDICMAIMAGGFVKTLWLNLTTDKHLTLNREKYASA